MVWYLCVNVFWLKQDFEMYIFGQNSYQNNGMNSRK